MELIQWLQELGRDSNPAAAGFQPRLAYLLVCIAMPLAIGMLVGFGLRFIERVLGVELGKGGH